MTSELADKAFTLIAEARALHQQDCHVCAGMVPTDDSPVSGLPRACAREVLQLAEDGARLALAWRVQELKTS